MLPKQHGSSNRWTCNHEICLGPEAEDKRGREHETLFYFDKRCNDTLSDITSLAGSNKSVIGQITIFCKS